MKNYMVIKKKQISIALLKEILDYIEESEQCIEADRGIGRYVENMIKEGNMPPLYFKIKKLTDEKDTK